jgi:hypothetical protein
MRVISGNFIYQSDTLVKIPCELNYEKSMTLRSASLVEVSADGSVIEDLSNKLKFEASETIAREGVLNLKLPKGHYRLYLKKWKLVYNIRVISTKGVKILDSDIIIQGTKILQNFKHPNCLHIENYTYDQPAGTFKLQLAHYSPNVKIYAVAKHFYDNEAAQHNIKYFNTMAFPSQITYTLPKQVNLYLYGRKLHEEYNYVIERKTAKKYIGNSLEKPTLILKRMFIRDTQTGEQKAKEGTEFKKMDISKGAEMDRKKVGQKDEKKVDTIPYYEFLSMPAKFYNLKHNDGLVEIHDQDLAKFSFLYFVIVDEDMVINKQITLKENQPKLQTKDLTLKAAFDENSGYQKRKNFDIISKGKQFEIEDVYNCDYQLFDGMDSVTFEFYVNNLSCSST